MRIALDVISIILDVAIIIMLTRYNMKGADE